MSTSTLTMNGASLSSPQSLSAEESEESFVVLSPSLAPDAMENLMSVHPSMVNSATSISSMPRISNELCQTINAMSVSATSELSSEEIHTKLESLLHENLQLKETLHQNNLAMKKQFSTLVAWQEDVMKVHQSHKEKFEETKKLISNLRAENLELKQSVSLPLNLPSADDTEIINLKSKIAALEFELDTLRQGYLKNQTEQSNAKSELEKNLSQAMKEKQEISESLGQQINTLKSDLTSVQEKLNVAQKKIFDMAANIPSVSAVQTIEKLNKELGEIDAELNYKNKVLKEKTDAMDKLIEKNKMLSVENEMIPILKTQVDLYQTDFNQERDARNAIAQEKEAIIESLRNLQHRNEQLTKEIEILKNTDFVSVSSSSRGASAPAEVNASSREYQYMCPKCSFSFKDYQSLENHVYRCIELDQLP